MKRFAPQLLAAALVSVVIATAYGMVQQSLRLSVNNAPRQAIDAYVANRDASEANFTRVNIAADSNVFLVVYDANGKPVGGDGYLNGRLAAVPVGVLKHSTDGHENAVSWQPRAGVRLATVTAKDGNQYILAGQSLRAYDDSMSRIGEVAFAGWFVAMLIIVGGLMLAGGSATKR